MAYFPLTPLDQRIWAHYKRCGVRSPGDITLFHWDKITRSTVIHRPGPTNGFPTRKKYTVFLNSEKSLPDRRIEMAHEIGHAIQHVGFQSELKEILRTKQEKQADYFSFYSLASSPLIWSTVYGDHWGFSVSHLSSIFGVTDSFMEERLWLFKKEMQTIAPDLWRLKSSKYDWGS